MSDFLLATVINHELPALTITPVVGLAAVVLAAVSTGAADRDETWELASAIQQLMT